MEQIQKDDVTSLYTADNIIGTDEGLDVKAFFKTVPKSDSSLAVLQKNVRKTRWFLECSFPRMKK